jgi:small subunit ribosomal protein S19e
MADSTARTVKDVNPHDFVKAYSAHLKRSAKVTLTLHIDRVRELIAGWFCLYPI